jgi:RNA polymerase sigma-70 factor (ECF subfamily)
MQHQERKSEAGFGIPDPALAALVRTQLPRLLELARLLLGNEGEARAVVQEAFVSTLRGLSAFDAASGVSAALRRATACAALARRRGGESAGDRPIEALLPAFTDDGHHMPVPREWPARAHSAATDERGVVRASIARLPDEYRLVLLLHDSEGWETGEIGRGLGLDGEIVKHRLHRARQALRTLLSERFGNPGRQPSASC